MIKIKKGLNEIISSLIKGRFFAECPHCQSEFSLVKANLFENENFNSEAVGLYEAQIRLIRQEKARLNQLKTQGNLRSEKGSKAVNIGKILERLTPILESFRFNKNDCRPLFDPLDYIIFDGLCEKNKVEKIFFIDVKTGGARLKDRQKEIKQVVCDQKIEFLKY